MREKAIIASCLADVGIAVGGEIVADLHAIGTREIIRLCRALLESGLFVLHGSSSKERFSTLLPSQADDSTKSSGNQNAVYAGTDAEQALVHATLNKRFLERTLASYTIGFRRVQGRMEVPVSDNLFELFQSGTPDLKEEGFVYVLLKSQMLSAFDSVGEFFTLQPIVPLASLRVPASVGEHILFTEFRGKHGTVVRYTEAEVQKIAAHLRAKCAALE